MPLNLSPNPQNTLSLIRALTEHPLHGAEANVVVHAFENAHDDAAHICDAFLRLQRLSQILISGLIDDEGLFAETRQRSFKNWNDYASPPVGSDLVLGLADKLYKIEKPSDVALVHTDDGVKSVAEELVRRLVAENIAFDMRLADVDFNTLVRNHADMQGIEALGKAYAQQLAAPMNKRMVALPGSSPRDVLSNNPEKGRAYMAAAKPGIDRLRGGEIHWVLTEVPGQADADFDGIPYQEYVRLFFELCDQPWARIEAAQAQLIKEFDAAETLHCTNKDGTDLSMSIKGMTFANSVIARNVPGAEIFSAPVKESVNGTLVAKGLFSPKGHRGTAIRDITLVFKDGKIVDFDATEGLEHLQKEIEIDEGSCYLGEIGIGGNPHLKRHVSSVLLCEKIGGSFHVALGDAYHQTDYMGVPVKIDNGNHSLLHWDITTMLYGKGGEMKLDGRVIQKDGYFLDPAYDVLNRGWQSVPREERPDYWKDYDFKAAKYSGYQDKT